ncbi:fungal-specific transcription factor domain-containing protein [Aspergillus varians]
MDVNAPGTVRQRRTREDRRRTARACDHCRRLKERCEGGIPCTRCTHLRRQCEFKRHLPPPVEPISPAEVNVRELLERTMYMEKILKYKVEGISLDIDNLRRMARALDDHEQSKNGPASSPLADEDPIEEEVCTIDPVEDTTTHYSGEFSYWNFSMRVKRHIEDRTHSHEPVQVSNYWRAEQLHSGERSIAAARSCCPPRHIADFLLNVFFNHAQTYYFCVDKAWLIDKVDALYDGPGKFTTKSAAVVSIILTVFAIATQYAYLDSPTQRAGGNAASEFSEDALGTMFYQQAIRFLPEIIEASSLESVQACLLFAVYALPVDASGLGYIYITLTNRLGMQNGMHRQYTGSRLSAAMIETRNAVWWTAYTLERRISIFHGRPMSTHRYDVDANFPTHHEQIQRDGPVPTVPYMVVSILLMRRLEEVSREMFLLRTAQKQGRSGILSRLVAGKNEMEAWWKTLPDEIHNDVLPQQTHSRETIHLRLEYCLVCMFIGRPLLLNRASSRSTPTSPDGSENRSPSNASANPDGNTSSNYGMHRQELVISCVRAAREALNLCRTLRDTGPGLARSSYIEYSSCRASLLVLIADSIQNPSAQYRAELRGGLDMIREMAAAGDSARSEVALLESLERSLARLRYSNENNDRDGDRHTDNGYEDFKHWEALWKCSGTPNQPADTPRVPAGQWSTSFSGHPPQGQAIEDHNYASPTALSNTSNVPSIQSPYVDRRTLYNEDIPIHPELRVLQEFLAIPGYRFDTDFGADSGFACPSSIPDFPFYPE